MQKRIKAIITILAILLTISVLLLAGTLLNYFCLSRSTTVIVPDNLISPETADEPIEQTIESHFKGSVKNTAASEKLSASKSQNGLTADVLYLDNHYNIDDNTPFQVTNMFPGDTETKYYCIRVSHNKTVTVQYHADIQKGCEKLAEVLKCRIVLLTTGEVLFDGLMRDMPESLKQTVAANASETSELYYQVTAYLDTSVGNDYQFQNLAADFRWWVEDDEQSDSDSSNVDTASDQNSDRDSDYNHNNDQSQNQNLNQKTDGTSTYPQTGDTGSYKNGTGVKTGDEIQIAVYVIVMFVSLFLIIVLRKKLRREDTNNE